MVLALVNFFEKKRGQLAIEDMTVFKGLGMQSASDFKFVHHLSADKMPENSRFSNLGEVDKF